VNENAYHGLPGEVVRSLAPFTEADPAGLLMTLLAACGAAIGPRPHAVADGARHPARLDVVLVGRSARARKGTSWAVIRRLLARGAPELVERRLIHGLSTGEGLVNELSNRDGDDRHVLVVEPEIARLLRSAVRSASLSALLRQAWDGDELSVLTRQKPIKVDCASVSIVGHITAEELQRRLDATDAANGFGNRLLFCWVERSQKLPHGGELSESGLDVLGARLGTAIARAKTIDRVPFAPEATQLWADLYCTFDDDARGVVGALLARAEAQLLRLALTYALLDGSSVIELAHLEAGAAAWRHSEATVHRLYGTSGPDQVLMLLLAALREAGPEGLDGTQQRDVFSRHLSGDRLAKARAALEEQGLARTVIVPTPGRPRVITFAIDAKFKGLWSPASLWSSHATTTPRTAREPIVYEEPSR
jgi:hypothetical protein